jgi:hypothetical protein
MTFSIRTIIRALVSPEHRIRCSRRLWKHILGELDRRGQGRHEAGVFLLGAETDGRLDVRDAVFYDDLDPDAYSTGICVLHGEAFALLWSLCRERRLTVAADVHTHAGAGIQSYQDKTNPMIARAGHIAIIVPNLAKSPVPHAELGVYEYRGQHQWTNLCGKAAGRFFYVGVWS